MSELQPRTSRDGIYVGVLTVLGLVLVWWAGEQFGGIRRVVGSEFRYPRVDLLLYLLTFVGAGVVFGLATAGDGATASTRRRAIAIWSLLPLLSLAAFYSIFGFGWPEAPLINVNVILALTNLHVGSALAFGFFVSRLATPRRVKPGD